MPKLPEKTHLDQRHHGLPGEKMFQLPVGVL
jgi:hypothetical protein